MAPADVVSAMDTPSQDEMGRIRGGPFIHLFIFLLFIYFIYFSNILPFVFIGGSK